MYHKLPGDTAQENYVGSQIYLARERRVLHLRGVIEDNNSVNGPQGVADCILAMSAENPDAPIWLFVDSPGGNIDTGFILVDTMRAVPAPIYTIGQFAASMGAIVLSAGDQRYVLPNSRTMLHLPSGRMQGNNDEVETQKRELDKMRDKLADSLIEDGVQRNREEIIADIKGERWMSAQEAVDYGLADAILGSEDYRLMLAA